MRVSVEPPWAITGTLNTCNVGFLNRNRGDAKRTSLLTFLISLIKSTSHLTLASAAKVATLEAISCYVHDY